MSYKFTEIRLEKGMYAEGNASFPQILEKLDPSENYRGTSYEGLDAYQRQLRRFDIKVRGAHSDTVEKFFRTSESAVLFPEYVVRSVRHGMDEEDVIPHISATITKVDGLDYRSIYPVVSEGAQPAECSGVIPQTQVKVRDNLVKLHKRGRMLVASYEAIRFQKLDLFSVLLRQIGSQIIRMHLDDAIGVITNGDGNDNAAEVFKAGVFPLSGTPGTIEYNQLLEFWNQFDPFTLNTLLVSPDAMLQILKCPEFQSALGGLGFCGTGEFFGPFGARVVKTSAVGSGTIIGLDKAFALEAVTSSGVIVECDKLIDRQFERAAITSVAGFAKLYSEASKVLKV